MTYQHFRITNTPLYIREDFFHLETSGKIDTEVVFSYNKFTQIPTGLHFTWNLEVSSGSETVLSMKLRDSYNLDQPATATKGQLILIARQSLQHFRQISAEHLGKEGIEMGFPSYRVREGIYDRMLKELKKRSV